MLCCGKLELPQGHLASEEAARRFWLHIQETEMRLVHALRMLQAEIVKRERILEEHGFDLEYLPPDITIKVIGDAIVHYLGLFIDDVGRLIPHVMGDTRGIDFDSFVKLKKKMASLNPPLFPELQSLFARLDTDTESWWKETLQYGLGIRQRLVHSPEFLCFAASQAQDGKWNLNAWLFGEKG
jgi:hypothetical protein